MKKHTLALIITCIVIINIALYFFFNRNSDVETLPVDVLFERSDYSQISSVPSDDIELQTTPVEARTQYLTSLLKLGSYNDAITYSKSASKLDDFWKQLYKMLIFYEKWDWTGLDNYVKILKNDSPKLRSLYIQMRALALYNQWNNKWATALANDVHKLDALAPAWLNLLWLINAKSKKWTPALKNFERAKILGHKENQETTYYQGLTEYNLKRYDAMQETLKKLLDDDVYWYDSLLILWRYEKSQWNNELAKRYFERAGKLPWSEKTTHLIELANIDFLEWNYVSYITYAQELLNENKLNFQDTLKLYQAYSKIWNTEQEKIIIAQIEDKLWKNVNNYRAYMNILHSLWEYDKTHQVLAQWLEAVPLTNTKWRSLLQNYSARTYIYQLIWSLGSESTQFFLDQLIRVEWVTNKERFVYIALVDFMNWEQESALRSLQEIKSTATVDDLSTIEILHYIYNGNIKTALQKLSSYSPDPAYDIDYQWLKWKVLSVLQDWADEYEQETIAQLEKLNQTDRNQNEINKSFEKRFNWRLKFMKHFYQ